MPTLHCWENNREWTATNIGYGSDAYLKALQHPATCTLHAEHEGDHKWCSDDDICVTLTQEAMINFEGLDTVTAGSQPPPECDQCSLPAQHVIHGDEIGALCDTHYFERDNVTPTRVCPTCLGDKRADPNVALELSPPCPTCDGWGTVPAAWPL